MTSMGGTNVLGSDCSYRLRLRGFQSNWRPRPATCVSKIAHGSRGRADLLLDNFAEQSVVPTNSLSRAFWIPRINRCTVQGFVSDARLDCKPGNCAFELVTGGGFCDIAVHSGIEASLFVALHRVRRHRDDWHSRA